MGLFDAIFGSKRPANLEVLPEQIWLTTEAKFAGIAKQLEQRSNADIFATLLVAHFPDVLAQLETLIDQSSGNVPCKAVLASQLKADLGTAFRSDGSALLEVIVAERHPLPAAEEQLEEFAGELPCRCRLSHHVSLDDAVVKSFVGPAMKDLLVSLGMVEDEAIESHMVSRRIRQSQQKIARHASGKQGAASATQWLELNWPEAR